MRVQKQQRILCRARTRHADATLSQFAVWRFYSTHKRMFDPKTPLQAAAIFVTGLAVIAYTTLDISRTLQLNSTPASAAQTEQLREQVAESQCEFCNVLLVSDLPHSPPPSHPPSNNVPPASGVKQQRTLVQTAFLGTLRDGINSEHSAAASTRVAETPGALSDAP